MAKKEFTYRGKTLEELQAMSIKDLGSLFTASARRKISRGFTDEEKKLLEKLKTKDNVKTHCRELIILPEMVGKTLLVFNGKSFEKVVIEPEMLGTRIGEFSLTRGRITHSSPGVGATKSSASVSVR